jgi:hypothetical protein
MTSMKIHLEEAPYERPAPNVRCDRCAFGTALEVGEIACHYSSNQWVTVAPDWWCEMWAPRGAKIEHVVPFWEPPKMGGEK